MIKSIAIRSILFAGLLSFAPSLSSAFVAITVAPPPLPVYEQPLCPGDRYLWVPGYWAWAPDVGDYYWVPGVWVLAPQVGFLWTPGWWGFEGDNYIWHAGYWGPTVGFYGGINYGFGYFGSGFVGGVWAGSVFRYNTAVWHVNTALVHNTYSNSAVINNTGLNNHMSFNGRGGISAKPTGAQEAALHEHHLEATAAQRQHELAALHDPAQRYSVNHGRPKEMALTKVTGTGEHQMATENKTASSGAEHRAPVTNKAGQKTTGTHNAAATSRTAATRQVEHNAATKPHTAATRHVEHNAAATPHTAATHHVEHNAATSHHGEHKAAAAHPVQHRVAETHQSTNNVHFEAHRSANTHPAAHSAPHQAKAVSKPQNHPRGGEKKK
jgi:WXXGXW repeat (2 copies)